MSNNSPLMSSPTGRNLLLFPKIKRVSKRSFDLAVSTCASVTRLDEKRNDAALLARAAPWMTDQIDVVNAWINSPFITRLVRCTDGSIDARDIRSAAWRLHGTKTDWVEGWIKTPAGKIKLEAVHPGDASEGCVLLSGSRAALLGARLAHEDWLNSDLHKGRRKTFKAYIFESERCISVTRMRERFFVRISVEESELAALDSTAREQISNARAEAKRAVEKLPTSRQAYLEVFSMSAHVLITAMENMALEAKGGYSLSVESQGKVFEKLRALRNSIECMSTSYSFADRQCDIAAIAHRFAPTK